MEAASQRPSSQPVVHCKHSQMSKYSWDESLAAHPPMEPSFIHSLCRMWSVVVQGDACLTWVLTHANMLPCTGRFIMSDAFIRLAVQQLINTISAPH